MYHILCGMIFDGSFFDYLNQNKALATSRRHCSGLDYLAVIYEDCAELRSLSNGLLRSYNRLANNICSLQSFGDAQGSRFDFYRVSVSWSMGIHLPSCWKQKDCWIILSEGSGSIKTAC